MAVLLLGSDNLIRILNLVAQAGGDAATPTPITTATVTAQLQTLAGINIGSLISCSFVSGTNGDYEGVVPNTVVDTLTENDTIQIEVIADDGSDRRKTWILHALVLYERVD